MPYSVGIPPAILARRNDGFLRLVEPTLTNTCCMDTQRCADTVTQPQTNTHTAAHGSSAPGDTFNHTGVATDTNVQTYACVHVRMYTHPCHKHTSSHGDWHPETGKNI